MTAPMIQRTRPAAGGRFQQAANTATQAAAQDAGDDLSRDVGARLGGLAGIGALRSGGAAQGVKDASRTYSQQVGRAAAANALQATALDQQEGASLRDLGFRQQALASGETQAGLERGSREGISRDTLASGERVSGLDRSSRETLAGNELGFRREDLAAQTDRFGRDLGFRERSLTSGEVQSGLDRGSREKLAADDLGFRRQGLASEENRFGQDLGFRKEQYAGDSTFRRTELDARTNQDNLNRQETQRQFNTQRQDAQKAAQAKKKSGLFGFLGKALGFAANFIPGGGLVKTGLKLATGIGQSQVGRVGF